MDPPCHCVLLSVNGCGTFLGRGPGAAVRAAANCCGQAPPLLQMGVPAIFMFWPEKKDGSKEELKKPPLLMWKDLQWTEEEAKDLLAAS